MENKREIKFRAWTGERMIESPYFFEQNFGSDNPLPYRCYEDWRELEDGRSMPCEIMQYTGLKGYEGDIIEVCVFLVSPSNTDDDQHFRGVIEFTNGCFVFVIHQYLKVEWIKLQPYHLPFHEAELDEDGTFTVPYFDFLGISGNLGEFNDDNVEIVGNIYENPSLLEK